MNPTRNGALKKRKDEDEEEAASFLLSLRQHCDRSATVSPDPERRLQQPPSCSMGVIQSSYPHAEANFRATLKPPQVNILECNVDFERLVAESSLVESKDRDLVPDALFVAMAQMQPCRLKHADRVGCYKSREIGFRGMSCKFCGGQPLFGRFFPATIRSLAQTTTSQTVLKHVSTKCRFVPAHIRNAVLDLQQQQLAQEGLPTGRPRYGSRKIFFQRVWKRLHGDGNHKSIVASEETETERELMTPKSLSSMPSNSSDGSVPISKGIKKRRAKAATMEPTKRAKTVESVEHLALLSTPVYQV